MVTLGSPETRVLDDDWTVVTTDGSRAAHWENTVAVTDAGLWVLTALDGGKERLEAAGAPYAPAGLTRSAEPLTQRPPAVAEHDFVPEGGLS